MSLNNRRIRIIKVPLSDNERCPDYPQSFPPMPRLYLELFENKTKIRQDLINREYMPKHQEIEPGKTYQEKPVDKDQEKPVEKGQEKLAEKKQEKPVEKEQEQTIGRDPEKVNYVEHTEIHEKISDTRSESHDSRRSEYSSGSRSESEESYHNRDNSHDSYDSREEKPERRESADSDDLSVRLKELLGDTDTESPGSREHYKSHHDKYSRRHKRATDNRSRHVTPYDKFKQNRQSQETHTDPSQPPPTLAELESKGHYEPKPVLRDINHIPVSEQDEEDKKRELMFKFDLLRKSYPNAKEKIPEYTLHSNYREMQKSYDTTVKGLSVDSTVENYKKYLVYGFMGVEFVCGNFFGFDMQGFTQQQIISMSSYDKLLIELGEKSYMPSGSKWPVELRLLFLIVINAGVFIVGKMIMKKTGANLMGMINGMNNTSANSNLQPQKPKRKMRGPTIDINDLPDAENLESGTTEAGSK